VFLLNCFESVTGDLMLRIPDTQTQDSAQEERHPILNNDPLQDS